MTGVIKCIGGSENHRQQQAPMWRLFFFNLFCDTEVIMKQWLKHGVNYHDSGVQWSRIIELQVYFQNISQTIPKNCKSCKRMSFSVVAKFPQKNKVNVRHTNFFPHCLRYFRYYQYIQFTTRHLNSIMTIHYFNQPPLPKHVLLAMTGGDHCRSSVSHSSGPRSKYFTYHWRHVGGSAHWCFYHSM